MRNTSYPASGQQHLQTPEQHPSHQLTSGQPNGALQNGAASRPVSSYSGSNRNSAVGPRGAAALERNHVLPSQPQHQTTAALHASLAPHSYASHTVRNQGNVLHTTAPGEPYNAIPATHANTQAHTSQYTGTHGNPHGPHQAGATLAAGESRFSPPGTPRNVKSPPATGLVSHSSLHHASFGNNGSLLRPQAAHTSDRTGHTVATGPTVIPTSPESRTQAVLTKPPQAAAINSVSRAPVGAMQPIPSIHSGTAGRHDATSQYVMPPTATNPESRNSALSHSAIGSTAALSSGGTGTTKRLSGPGKQLTMANIKTDFTQAANSALASVGNSTGQQESIVAHAQDRNNRLSSQAAPLSPSSHPPTVIQHGPLIHAVPAHARHAADRMINGDSISHNAHKQIPVSTARAQPQALQRSATKLHGRGEYRPSHPSQPAGTVQPASDQASMAAQPGRATPSTHSSTLLGQAPATDGSRHPVNGQHKGSLFNESDNAIDRCQTAIGIDSAASGGSHPIQSQSIGQSNALRGNGIKRSAM